MSARDAGGAGRDLRAPSGIDAEYRRLGRRLLRRLGEPGMWAERRGDQIVLSREGTSVSLAAGMPTGVLSLLLEDGALACARRGGRSFFAITEAGRARLRREEAEEDPFATQHRALETREIETPEGPARVRINTREDPLDLFRGGRAVPGLVGPAEIEAGDRLARDFVLAQSLPQVTANWSRLAVDGAGYNPGLSPPERVAEARRRVDGAMRAVGPDFSGILLDICGFSKGIEAGTVGQGGGGAGAPASRAALRSRQCGARRGGTGNPPMGHAGPSPGAEGGMSLLSLSPPRP